MTDIEMTGASGLIPERTLGLGYKQTNRQNSPLFKEKVLAVVYLGFVHIYMWGVCVRDLCGSIHVWMAVYSVLFFTFVLTQGLSSDPKAYCSNH